MPRKLENRIAMITGASRGIGRAIAIRFAEEGIIVANHLAQVQRISFCKLLII